ncbi:protein LONGIFOLIA 1 [Sesamum alatum]|uniref:Protein LONGIFOLIA 1 n=1 Tax=Sesamum alatum TaxID=300844 RepID=A0AAE2CDN9_9LAMI|nr:protein LONGIFOLIA 1 [Sesamum alatum]
MSTGLVEEHNLEKQIKKQMGCMAGFLQLFDRHQILSGKRLYSAKRLPSSPVGDTTSDSEKSAPASPAISREYGKPKQPYSAAPSPESTKLPPTAELRSPVAAAAAVAELPPKSPLPLPIFELKEGTKSSWKFCKEAPRLSLDSRATTDAKGGLHPKEIRTGSSILSTANRCDSIASDANDESQQHRSPSVIARLMGLEPLSDSSSSEPEKMPELRRSASESRVSRDLFHSRFIAEESNFSSKHPVPPYSGLFNNVMKGNVPGDAHYADPRNYLLKNVNKAEPPKGLNRGSFNSSSPWKASQHRKSFFDSGDFFPEPRQSASIYGEIESRLRMRGIEEPSKDLETLKQILEALQLKGLLHSRKPSEQNQVSHRNIVYDESPIVVMKPSTPYNRRTGNDYSPSNSRNQVRGVRRNYSYTGENSPSVSPRRDRNVQSPTRTGRSPSPTTTTRSEGNAVRRRSNSLVKPKPVSVETQRRTNESTVNRRVSPVHSPKLNSRRTGPDSTVNNRSPRSKKTTSEIHQKEKITTVVAAEDESSSVSGSSITTSTDTDRWKTEEYKEGRNLLERCDKLLHSIAEMTAADMQPSPVSVLDSSFYKDESSTPSPVTTRRNIDFKDHSSELEDEICSPVTSSVGSKSEEISCDSDFVYISDVLNASRYLPDESNVFLLLEKQQCVKGKDTSKASRLQRKLIFDTINEILDRNRRLPPWKVVYCKPSLDKVWSEFERIREHERGDDLFETVCGVLKKDLDRDAVTGWGDCPVEMSEVILDMERLIFKDLISETIRELAALASRSTLSSSCVMPRRKLVF